MIFESMYICGLGMYSVIHSLQFSNKKIIVESMYVLGLGYVLYLPTCYSFLRREWSSSPCIFMDWTMYSGPLKHSTKSYMHVQHFPSNAILTSNFNTWRSLWKASKIKCMTLPPCWYDSNIWISHNSLCIKYHLGLASLAIPFYHWWNDCSTCCLEVGKKA